MLKKCPVLIMDTWRIPCLLKFLTEQHRLELLGEEMSEVASLILSLVTSKSTIILIRGIQNLTIFWSLARTAF